MWMWNLDSLFFLKASSSFFFLIKKSWAKKIKADIGVLPFFEKKEAKKALAVARKGEKPALGLKKNKSQHYNKSRRQEDLRAKNKFRLL